MYLHVQVAHRSGLRSHQNHQLLLQVKHLSSVSVEVLNECSVKLKTALCPLWTVTDRAARTTSPLWPWTPGTGRCSTPLATPVKRCTSTCAGRWCRWEVRVHASPQSFLRRLRSHLRSTSCDRLVGVSFQCSGLYEGWQ